MASTSSLQATGSKLPENTDPYAKSIKLLTARIAEIDAKIAENVYKARDTASQQMKVSYAKSILLLKKNKEVATKLLLAQKERQRKRQRKHMESTNLINRARRQSNPPAASSSRMILPPLPGRTDPFRSHPNEEKPDEDLLAELDDVKLSEDEALLKKQEADLLESLSTLGVSKTDKELLDEFDEEDNRIKAALIAQIVSIITTIIPLIQPPKQNRPDEELIDLQRRLNVLRDDGPQIKPKYLFKISEAILEDLKNNIKSVKDIKNKPITDRISTFGKFTDSLNKYLEKLKEKVNKVELIEQSYKGGAMSIEEILAKVESENRIKIGEAIKQDFIKYYNAAVDFNNNPGEFNGYSKSDQIIIIQKCMASFQALVDDINTQLTPSSGGQKQKLNILFNSRNMYKSGGLKNKSRKMKGGAEIVKITNEVIESLDATLRPFALKLNEAIEAYNIKSDDDANKQKLLLPIASAIVVVLEKLYPAGTEEEEEEEEAPAPEAVAEAAPEAVAAARAKLAEARAQKAATAQALIDTARDGAVPSQKLLEDDRAADVALEEAKAAAIDLGIEVADGGRKKKVATRKVKRGGAIDMSKLYNVSGLIVDSKDPVAMAAQVGQDSTPMPFSASGQGITYSAGIPEQFMRDLNPTLGMAGGKKRTVGSAKTQDKQRAGSAKTQDKQRAGSAKTQDKKRKDSANTKSKK